MLRAQSFEYGSNHPCIDSANLEVTETGWKEVGKSQCIENKEGYGNQQNDKCNASICFTILFI